jgi:type II secretory pathway component PulK
MIEPRLANSELGSLVYDSAPESAQIAKLKSEYGLFINGDFTRAPKHEQFASVNPATEETLAMVAQASAADVDRTVASARKAYDTVWS